MQAQTWRGYLIVLALVIAVGLAGFPLLGSTQSIVTSTLAAGLMATRAVALSRLAPPDDRGRRRSAPALAVAVMAGGLFLNSVAEALWNAWPTWFGEDPPYPGPSDVFWLAFYPTMAAGLFWLVRHRSAGRDRTAAIDSTIVTVGAGVVLWKFLMIPLGSDSELGLLGRLVGVAYPVGDLLLLAVGARLALVAGRRPPALRLLLGAIAMLFVADIVYLWSELEGTYALGSSTDALYDFSYALFGAAALHPSFRELLSPAEPTRWTEARWGRLGLLTGATLLAPAVAATDGHGLALVPIGASAVMFLLVMARVSGLMRAVEQSGERRFRSLVQHATDFVLVVDDDGIVTYCSPSTSTALGIRADAAGSMCELVHPDDVPAVLGAVVTDPAASGPTPTATIETRVRFADGSWRTVEMTVTDLRADSDVAGYVINAHDIDQLRRLASYDSLTGLLNRAELSRRLDEALATGEWCALLLYDLDGFKEINDSLGHAAGDAVLIEVGRRLQAQVRHRDIVARLGGDEFAVLLHGDDAFAAVLAERTLGALGEPIALADLAVGIEASVGVVERRPDHRDAQDLLRDADLAMYAAKAAGKGRATTYDASMGLRAMHHVELRSALHAALAGNQLELHYQPVFRLDTGGLDGFEALLRWQHPERGWISPADFIPAAEESNQIITIGRWVLDQAARQLAHWRRLTGPAGHHLTMAVNLSPRQLSDANLVTDLRGILGDAGLEPSALCLEITEGAVVANATVAARALAELRAIGVRLAIDDYGSGNASISYLRQFAVDTLKIDRSLVEHLDDDHGTSVAIVRSIIELASALGLTTVGEGIETAAQRDALRRLGCSIGQGYLLARPMDAGSVARGLKAMVDVGSPRPVG